MSFFVSPAYAQGAGGAGGGDMILQFLPLVLIFVIFYFLLIRPQQKKVKQHREMVASLRRGDKVVTSGGIIGTVAKVIDDNRVMVDLADSVRVEVVRSTIAEVLSKTEPASSSSDSKDSDDDDAPAKKGGKK